MKRKSIFKPIAVSKIRARAVELAFEQATSQPSYTTFNRNTAEPIIAALGWRKALKEFRCPGMIRWSRGKVPMRIIGQLFGQVMNSGMTVWWRGRQYLVVEIDILPEELYSPCWEIMDALFSRSVTIAPIEHIDLKS